MNEGYQQLPNIGILVKEVPKAILNNLKSQIDNSTELVNNTLVGHIKKEYKLSNLDTNFKLYLYDLFNQYNEESDILHYHSKLNTGKKQIVLGDTWVNFQAKGEFNPVHIHSGVVSFVIWIKIPFKREDEEKMFEIPNGGNKSGMFEFQYNFITGGMVTKVIEAEEGKICMFPSNLHHSVYPFYTSDDYRISISGNLYLKGVEDDF